MQIWRPNLPTINVRYSAKELIALDDERRSIWNRIDKFLAGTPESKIEKKEEAEKVLEQNMLVVGESGKKNRFY